MRAHRGSSVTDGHVGFRVSAGVTLIVLQISYGIGSIVPPIPLRCTPILAFKFNCAPPWLGATENAFGPMKWLGFHHGELVAGGDYGALRFPSSQFTMDAAIRLAERR